MARADDVGQPYPFDLARLYECLDEERRRQGISWTRLGQQIGVAASTIKRCGHALDMEADGILAMVRWLGVPPERFVADAAGVGDPLPMTGGGMVRADTELMWQVAGCNSRRRHAGGRTSIQRLARAASLSGRSIASLTRRTEV